MCVWFNVFESYLQTTKLNTEANYMSAFPLESLQFLLHVLTWLNASLLIFTSIIIFKCKLLVYLTKVQIKAVVSLQEIRTAYLEHRHMNLSVDKQDIRLRNILSLLRLPFLAPHTFHTMTWNHSREENTIVLFILWFPLKLERGSHRNTKADSDVFGC